MEPLSRQNEEIIVRIQKLLEGKEFDANAARIVYGSIIHDLAVYFEHSPGLIRSVSKTWERINESEKEKHDRLISFYKKCEILLRDHVYSELRPNLRWYKNSCYASVTMVALFLQPNKFITEKFLRSVKAQNIIAQIKLNQVKTEDEKTEIRKLLELQLEMTVEIQKLVLQMRIYHYPTTIDEFRSVFLNFKKLYTKSINNAFTDTNMSSTNELMFTLLESYGVRYKQITETTEESYSTIKVSQEEYEINKNNNDYFEFSEKGGKNTYGKKGTPIKTTVYQRHELVPPIITLKAYHEADAVYNHPNNKKAPVNICSEFFYEETESYKALRRNGVYLCIKDKEKVFFDPKEREKIKILILDVEVLRNLKKEAGQPQISLTWDNDLKRIGYPHLKLATIICWRSGVHYVCYYFNRDDRKWYRFNDMGRESTFDKVEVVEKTDKDQVINDLYYNSTLFIYQSDE